MNWDWWVYRAQPKAFIEQLKIAMTAKGRARRMDGK